MRLVDFLVSILFDAACLQVRVVLEGRASMMMGDDMKSDSGRWCFIAFNR